MNKLHFLYQYTICLFGIGFMWSVLDGIFGRSTDPVAIMIMSFVTLWCLTKENERNRIKQVSSTSDAAESKTNER